MHSVVAGKLPLYFVNLRSDCSRARARRRVTREDSQRPRGGREGPQAACRQREEEQKATAGGKGLRTGHRRKTGQEREPMTLGTQWYRRGVMAEYPVTLDGWLPLLFWVKLGENARRAAQARSAREVGSARTYNKDAAHLPQTLNCSRERMLCGTAQASSQLPFLQ